MKKKAFIYGCAQLGIQIAWHISEDYDFLGFIDTDPRKHTANGGGYINIDGKNYTVYHPDILKNMQFDKIFIGSEVDIYIKQIKNILFNYGIKENSIDMSLTFIPYYARLNFIKLLSLEFENKKIKGSVAELGVFRGETAKEINKFFKNDVFYLLDTFEGFDIRDCKNEKEQGLSKANIGDFSNTSLDYVKSKMLYVDNCRFVKGYFPETSNQIPNKEVFKFVNIDVDLYQPILAGLEFFYPRMVDEGVILIHDYFHPYYTGSKKAVDEFCLKYNLEFFPIGDAFSVTLIKNKKSA
ncbi:TylF/MycF family methyltransferase [Campylobacter sp. IFREMER_LSEM_CL292]|uniref:TylF/MycF family methyltransferase n=1 Tax=Campylobacter sp. IFREMER_LSEM_CL292 TaxID=2911623 RepID=UPI0021E861FB|nr:TylF/MycF family methyltransferase [Campylobacter sp. IFREMER_LSEM_CL292]MCV3383726.1 TylF/MycF family methyltransferase [Campylobacter sp. IFREMER_LSEM_CL292]